MPKYTKSRALDALGGFVAEPQYLVYNPEGLELIFNAWRDIGAVS